MREIIFLADGRDFHAIDWYKATTKICSDREVYIATDILKAEGREVLLNKSDNIICMQLIDKWLLRKQSTFGNYWRNFVKVLFLPLQVASLKKIAKQYPDAIFHAHTMYYLFIAWQAGIEYIGSPQGAEILIRPYCSKLYHYFAKKSLKRAKFLIVDSENLKQGIRNIANRDADVMQYGIDVTAIQQEADHSTLRNGIVSIRAWYPLYRIAQIIQERNNHLTHIPLLFFFPFSEMGYVKNIMGLVKPMDTILGRLPQKKDIYTLLAKTELVISIPESDSSPRSVYESIFCGCAVVVTYNPWIDSLPECMRARIIIIDIHKPGWIAYAIKISKEILKTKYIPSEEAYEMFDQERSMKKVANKYYQ